MPMARSPGVLITFIVILKLIFLSYASMQHLDCSCVHAWMAFSSSLTSSVSLNLRVMLTMPLNKYRAISSLTLILTSLAGYSCNAQ